jgi:hypothetical protein
MKTSEYETKMLKVTPGNLVSIGKLDSTGACPASFTDVPLRT